MLYADCSAQRQCRLCCSCNLAEHANFSLASVSVEGLNAFFVVDVFTVIEAKSGVSCHSTRAEATGATLGCKFTLLHRAKWYGGVDLHAAANCETLLDGASAERAQ